MTTSFVDASFLIAVLRKGDAPHGRAMAWQKALTGSLLTTEYVLVEVFDAMSAPLLRLAAASSIAVLRARPAVRVVPATTSLLNEGIDWFTNHRDKRWSLTDCISFVVMRRQGITDALTSDHDFEQAGFRAMLRSEPP